ncbi:hypothetical protein LSH36_193g12116 [Paralvinella palmiformis]|uniref:Uncharacterized protein n=1 Tax=Paralvinella palmiformis TaxID=53620 RepID=A0AAD9N7X1_9ANNE|nr:hypothetical protein LSH36_193g12116 [Paralvinella palmiformis]
MGLGNTCLHRYRAKIVMYSQYERQKDKRPFTLRRDVFSGPVFGFPASKINPQKKVIWNADTGIPQYKDLEGGSSQTAEEEE